MLEFDAVVSRVGCAVAMRCLGMAHVSVVGEKYGVGFECAEE